MNKFIVAHIKDNVDGHTWFCGRPSPLGNPYYMHGEYERDEVCDRYEELFYHNIEIPDSPMRKEVDTIVALVIKDTEPVYLTCLCAPKRCHCDTIAEYLNNRINNE